MIHEKCKICYHMHTKGENRCYHMQLEGKSIAEEMGIDTKYFQCYHLESNVDISISRTYNVIRRFRRCVEAHVSRVTVWTDKAGGRTGKGARAEERYHLLGILSGCAVKSCMFVTRMMSSQNTSFGQVECYDMKKVFDDASLALLTERLLR